MPASSAAASIPSRAAASTRTAADERDAAIDRVLADISARVRSQHRRALEPGDVIAIPRDGTTLVYAIEGELRVSPSGPRPFDVRDVPVAADPHACAASAPQPSGSATATALLAAGDAQLFTGRAGHSIRAADRAFALICTLDFTDAAAHVLDLLPPTILVRDLPGSDPAVAALASMLGPEIGRGPDVCDSQPGSSVVCGMMANTVLVSVIRTWAIRGCAPDGWPSRTNDPFLDRVVEAIHADPARDWTLEDLARTGAMSRSVFAERFRLATGTSPANYLAEVRIRSAQELLARGLGVSEVSRAIGYGSDDGFSRAFRRRVGLTPSAWRSGARRGPGA